MYDLTHSAMHACVILVYRYFMLWCMLNNYIAMYRWEMCNMHIIMACIVFKSVTKKCIDIMLVLLLSI